MRILLIEDQEKLATSIKKFFKLAGFAVDICDNSDTGYSFASTEDYDCLIIDRMLPGQYEGLELVQKLRAEKNNTPILILTARGKLIDKVQGLNFGADDYLVKPFELAELLARVKALLRRPSNTMQDNKLTINKISIDLDQKKCLANGREINFTPKEFALLEYLMRNPNKTLSKESIINHVWDYDADILDNTVEVFIAFLRQKLKKSGTDKYIKTIRGFGYTIDGNV